MASETRLARLAGIFYLIVAVTGGFSQLFVRESLIDAGDAATTANNIAQIFFDLWLLPLGYLVYESGFLPRALHVILMVGTFCYLAELDAGFLFPGIGDTAALLIAVPAAVAEVSFLFWLLIKGVKANPRLDPVPVAA